MTRNASAARSHDKSNGNDRVVRTLRVYESGRVVPLPGRPPKDWAAIMTRARAHALPQEDKPTNVEAPAVKVKDPRKVAAGRARAEKARLAREAAAKTPGAVIDATVTKGAKKAKAKPTAKRARADAAARVKPAPKARGGARPGTGPKPKDASGKALVVVAFRVSPEQKKKLAKLGNGEFIRDRIDRATVPTKK